MPYDQFTVTSFDPQTGHGYLRQTVSADHSPLRQEPVGFNVGVGSGVCEFYLAEEGDGLRIPAQEIAQRVPAAGTTIMGVIALDPVNGEIALDELWSPFLRNWFYTDQYDAAMAGATEVGSDDFI